MSNFAPEFVSDNELDMLIENYTVRIEAKKKLTRTASTHEERKKMRREMLDLMRRRYYLRICLRARNEETIDSSRSESL